MARLKITLVKSPIGSLPRHRKTVRALGLRKMNQSVEKDDNPAVRGMAAAVGHLVRLEEVK
jgi:large subunit ribosomal protein L30